jgi:hypothetical protein
MKSKHFKTESAMLEWINEEGILFEKFKGIVKDLTNGDWIVFYLDL